MKTTRTLKMLLILMLVGWAGVSNAENWSGSVGNKTYSSNTTVNVTGNTTLTGAVKVTGGTLTINASGANRTISRGSNNTNALFTISNGARLVINGGTYKITIDGISKANCGSAIVVNVGGTATLTDVTIQNNFRKKSPRPKTSEHTDGGGIYTRGTLTCNNCNFINNRADFGGAICVYNRGDAVITGGNIIRNIAYWRGGGVAVGNTATFLGPAFDTSLSGNATVTLSGVTIGGSSTNKNTASELFGGGLYVAYKRGKAIVTNNTNISYNQSQYGGHGVCVSDMGEADLGACFIHHNSPCGDKSHDYGGGGLYIGGTIDDGASATIKAGCMIYQNTAARGAGVNLQANMELRMQGGAIYENYTYYSSNNVAINTTTGGGVYLGGDASDNKGKFTMTGGIIRNNTTANNGDGGGVYIAAGTVNISGGEIYENLAAGRGGGIFNNLGSLTMSGGSVRNNQAKTGSADGGGFYLTNGNATISGTAAIYSNLGKDGGGVFLNRGTFTMNGGEVYGNTATNRGGGIYLTANCTFNMTGGNIGKLGAAKNTAKQGGGVYDLGKFTLNGGALANNQATNGEGGGAYINTTNQTLLSNGSINDNTASNHGGGIYITNSPVRLTGTSVYGNAAVNAGGGIYLTGTADLTMTGGNIGGTTAQGNSITSGSGYGGGLYMAGGTATLSGGNISGNKAIGGYGGGIHMQGGTCTLSSGANIGGENATYANTARLGGGIHSAGGSITVNGGHIDYNIATADGGGIYSNDPSATVRITKQGTALSFMQHNTAVNGGGIFANRGTVTFDDGNVNYNYASQAGGGMYVNDEGILYLKGNAILSRNHVPSGMKGGGVYLRGTVVVGQVSKALTSIKADDNFAFTTDDPENYTCDKTTRNNIYLPEPIANPYTSNTHRDVITVIENGIDTTSHVGFSVPHNHVPVIFCQRSSTSWVYLDRFTTGLGHNLNTTLFDDTEHYKSVHYTEWPEAFDPDHVYLYGFWPEAVTSLDDVPVGGFIEEGDTVTIRNKEGFAWLISYVNGLNDSDPHNSADLVVNLEADVDMSEFGWVPIGFKGDVDVLPRPFNGTFNGNGHLITGVNGMVYGQGEEGVSDYGLFGYVTGGTIQDVFVQGMEYYIDNNPILNLGGLAGENEGGILCNSEVQSKLVSQSAESRIGGLVGKQVSGTLHSSIGIADMTGGRMGGLVGELAGGNLYNSFANSKFTSKNTNMYSGGLVAINRGTVENCYSRLRGTAPSGNFGILVGDNTSGTVNYCYAPAGMTNYKAAGAAPTGHGNYGDSFLPYLYRHRDTQVSLADSNNNYLPAGNDVDKQMLIALNNWVNQDNIHKATYTKWGRPWHASNDLKPLNDDYPILRMPLNDAVAAKQGDPYLYYGPIDTLLVKYTAADQAIWMYRNNSNVQGTNVNAESKLYIAEDVALIHNDTINAYVGITLDNSAGVNGANPQGGVSSVIGIATDSTDWHMISSPLAQAPIGINYSSTEQFGFSYGHPDGMPYYRFFPKDNPKHGYFPSHRFGTEYSEADNTATVGGNYYNEWDFYSYDEPQYHWINFKRNSTSHWHIDDPEHDWQIIYDNESSMTPGKGYFGATREETFLQCYGMLNHGEINDTVTQTLGVPRHGYNLLGNPYQAYLDFTAFVEANSDDVDAIWDDPMTASYTIIDEDARGYQTFAYGSSSNPFGAGRFIHPHQGFFVLLRDRTGAKAYFYPTMRNASDTVSSQFRGEAQPNYPLVNLFVSEANGNTDMVTVELGRPDEGGAPLMQALRSGNGKIWCHYNDEDWAIAYTQPGITEVGIRFESVEDTEYTLRWNTYNGQFSYLHIIDNMTGADVDCLSESEYKFSSSTSDYKSRFRLVFGYTDIEENDIEATDANFAFMMGDEMVVNSEGVLQVFDMSGRLVTSRELHGVQSTVMLPNVANGVYVLRLTEGTQSRVQKMVISK